MKRNLKKLFIFGFIILNIFSVIHPNSYLEKTKKSLNSNIKKVTDFLKKKRYKF